MGDLILTILNINLYNLKDVHYEPAQKTNCRSQPCIIFLQIQAQSYDTTQYYGKMNYVFHHVNKSQISTGLLRDYGIEFLNLDNYTGTALHDSNYVAMDEWRMLYTSLYSSQINGGANMLYLDTVNRLINKFNYSSMPISFIGLHYSYNKLRDDAVTNNLMYVSNDQLYDVSGRTQTPYESRELFAVAPIRQAALTGNNSFIFRPELFLSNTGKTISSIAYDAAGGNNYQTIGFNTSFNVYYSSTGFYNFNIRITYTDNSVRYSHTKVVVYQNPGGGNINARYGTRPVSSEIVGATKAYLGVFAEGDITIDLAVSNTTGQIRKPLIVVEGFDPYNFSGYNQYIPSLNTDENALQAITLNSGLDNVNEYDLIFLNYKNGTDYIQRNAFLLERVIEIVNNRKTTWNGVRQQNVIIGLSMGGLVARYALRDMEINNFDHETRLFISHDSPHWGANVPVGAQAAVQHLAPWKIINAGGSFPWISWRDMFPQAVDALNLFNSPAAKQMVIQRYILSNQTLTADNSVHTSFLSELNQLGWPVNCRNLTISNGACNGARPFADNSTMFTIDGSRSMTYFGNLWRSFLITLGSPFQSIGLINGWGNPQFNNWAMLWQFPLSLFATGSSIDLDFKVRAVPVSGTQEIYRGDVYSRKKILWLIDVNNYFIKCHVISTTGMLPLDNAPGGIYDVDQFGISASTISSQLPSFFQGYVQATTLQPKFCFVPTVSSLAVANPETNLRTNICTNLSCLKPTNVSDFFAPQQNELHISYTQASTDWILQQQDPFVTCTRHCATGITISGDNSFCTTSTNYSITNLPQGATVTWTASPSGTVMINSPNSAQTTVTKTNDGLFTLIATVNNVCDGQITITKQNIQVGLPTIDLVTFSNGANGGQYFCTSHVGNQFELLLSFLPGSGSVEYRILNWPALNVVYTSPTSYPLGGSIPVYYIPSPGWYLLEVKVTTTCGSSPWTGFEVEYVDCSMMKENQYFSIQASPNPTQGDLYVKIEDEQDEVKALSKDATVQFELVDVYTNQRVRQWKFKNDQQQFMLDVRGLRKGIYVLTASKGKYRQSKKIVVD